MKSRVLLFFAVVIPLLVLLPAVNLWSFAVGDEPRDQTLGEFLKGRRKTLYKVDMQLSAFAAYLYPFGISTDPGKVIIGRKGWLFLGDLFEKTISRKRVPTTGADLQKVKDIARATGAWRVWLADHGVRLFLIQIAPDKGSIYPEYMPDWVRSVPGSLTDTLLAWGHPEIFIDSRPGLRAARESLGVPVYFRTDTHWNNAGGWLGYLQLARVIAAREQAAQWTALTWVTQEHVHVGAPLDRAGGDLGQFLLMEAALHDLDIPVRVDIGRPLIKQEVDFNTGEIVLVSDNPQVNPPAGPLLARSPNALNQSRLLWLRDSFGVAMSPFISATFSETVHLHYRDCPPEELIRLVQVFRPHYVVVTVVEMAVLSEFFTQPPPLAQSKRLGLKASVHPVAEPQS